MRTLAPATRRPEASTTRPASEAEPAESSTSRAGSASARDSTARVVRRPSGAVAESSTATSLATPEIRTSPRAPAIARRSIRPGATVQEARTVAPGTGSPRSSTTIPRTVPARLISIGFSSSSATPSGTFVECPLYGGTASPSGAGPTARPL